MVTLVAVEALVVRFRDVSGEAVMLSLCYELTRACEVTKPQPMSESQPYAALVGLPGRPEFRDSPPSLTSPVSER